MVIKNKVVLITGGAVRVGAAITRTLAEAGAKIMCHYHSSSQEASELAREVESEGGQIAVISADLTDSRAREALVRSTMAQWGRIDVLINNSALFYRTPLGTVREEDWDIFHNLNLKSVFFLSQAVSQVMLQQASGKIINIGDTAAETPFPAYIPYTLTKAGVVSMTRGLAKALAPHIQVNCINPGPVMLPEDISEEEKQFALEQTLLKREGSGKDIAETVRFLLEGSDFITGAVIPVDGGRQIR